MNKLLSLKEWLTLEESAEHLSRVFQEHVSVADLYRFALQGHLTLSAYFINHARAKLGARMRIRDAGFRILPALFQEEEGEARITISLTSDAMPEFEAWLEADANNKLLLESEVPKQKFVILNGNQLSATDCVSFEREVQVIEGIWDLPLMGAERLDIEHALQKVTGGPSVNLTHLDGAYACRADGSVAWLQEHISDNEYAREKDRKKARDDSSAYYPAGGLPNDAPVIVRVANLLSFIARASGASGTEKPLDERERTTLLCIIGALAREAGIDLSQPMKAGDAVVAIAPELKLSGRTIGEKLKQVTEAMDRRTQ